MEMEIFFPHVYFHKKSLVCLYVALYMCNRFNNDDTTSCIGPTTPRHWPPLFLRTIEIFVTYVLKILNFIKFFSPTFTTTS